MEWIRIGFLIILLALAVYQDITKRKIKNWLTVMGLLIGLILSLFHIGQGILMTLAGAGIALLIGFALWLLGMFRAGDAKLLCAVGALIGWSSFINCFLLIIIIGGILSLIILLSKKLLIKRIKRIYLHMKYLFLNKTYETYQAETGSEYELPFAVPIALGSIISIFVSII